MEYWSVNLTIYVISVVHAQTSFGKIVYCCTNSWNTINFSLRLVALNLIHVFLLEHLFFKHMHAECEVLHWHDVLTSKTDVAASEGAPGGWHKQVIEVPLVQNYALWKQTEQFRSLSVTIASLILLLDILVGCSYSSEPAADLIIWH